MKLGAEKNDFLSVHQSKLMLLIILSLLVHLASIYTGHLLSRLNLQSANRTEPLKIKIVDSKLSQDIPIVEVKQKETIPPVKPKIESEVDHRAQKQMQTSRVPMPLTPSTAQSSVQTKSMQKVVPKNSISMSEQRLRPRADISEKYKILLPTTSQLTDSFAKGQQQFIDDDIDLGEALDIDSRNTRWVGYFSHLRTAIEYVWIYPNESVMRGQEGEARVLFVIQEDGSVSKVRLLQSTGYKTLDEAILEAIKLAAPFPPLPKNAEKSRLPVTGTFRYILSSSFASSSH